MTVIANLDPAYISRMRLPDRWRDIVARYSKPDTGMAIGQLLSTGLPLFAATAALLYGLGHGIWPALIFALPAALFLVRLFIIQHDCGHGSFLKSRRANDRLGRAIGVLTLTPYAFWRRSHTGHHATSGNLERRGTGDLTTLTVREYLARSVWGRLLYRLYRHPVVLFGVGPVYLLLFRYRVPLGNPLRDWEGWLSILGTNAAAAVIFLLTALVVGFGAVLLAYGVVLMLAMAVGVWFFYVQHQFEDAYWEVGPQWDFRHAALAGSSFFDLPRALHWLTGWIGFHHIHHLASKIPNYRLRACFEQTSEFQHARRVTLWEGIKCLRLALWDEDSRKLVSFRHVGRIRRRSSGPDASARLC
ncbi:MAG TPA: fatty acid desaturase [Stellaceae bacterium]|nr:fatty acid desaturase [Stellaceae bacterium]